MNYLLAIGLTFTATSIIWLVVYFFCWCHYLDKLEDKSTKDFLLGYGVGLADKSHRPIAPHTNQTQTERYRDLVRKHQNVPQAGPRKGD